MQRYYWVFLFLLGLSMLSACHEQQIELHNDEEPSTESNTVTKENAVSVEYEPAETVQNHGRFAEAYLSVLDKGQQTVILEYFEAYYMTLATLEHRDISMLFSCWIKPVMR